MRSGLAYTASHVDLRPLGTSKIDSTCIFGSHGVSNIVVVNIATFDFLVLLARTSIFVSQKFVPYLLVVLVAKFTAFIVLIGDLAYELICFFYRFSFLPCVRTK